MLEKCTLRFLKQNSGNPCPCKVGIANYLSSTCEPSLAAQLHFKHYILHFVNQVVELVKKKKKEKKKEKKRKEKERKKEKKRTLSLKIIASIVND